MTAAAPTADRAERLMDMNREAMHAGFDAGFRTACDLFDCRITGLLDRFGPSTHVSGEALRKMADAVRRAVTAAPPSPPPAGKIPESDPPLVRTGQGDFTHDVSPEDLRP